MKQRYLLFIFFFVSLVAAFAVNDLDPVAKKAKKDKPAKTVPVFQVPSSPDYASQRNDDEDEMNNAEDGNNSAESAQFNDSTIDEHLSLSARLESIIEKSKTYTATTTQRVKTGRGRRRKTKTIKVTKTLTRNYTLGMYVYDITADSVIFARNENSMLKPASTQKLFVSTAFLNTQGNDFNFETKVSANGKVVKDSIGRPFFKGDIYLQGSFDPTLTMDDVRAISNAILTLNVDSIDGKIIVDDHIKAAIMQSKGWQWDKTPLSEEYSFTPLYFNEGKANGRHVRHPELYFASTVGKQLMADSIRFSTSEPWDVSMTPVEGNRHLFALVTPCERVLQRMIKRSNNTYAEAIMLNLCKDDKDWSYENCRNVVRSTVRKAGISQDYYHIVDGSGLSHDNRCTAKSEVDLLRYVYSKKKLFNNMYNLLPIAGVDGTIRNRMKKGAAYNNVRAKTGTINAVSTLSGYVTTADNHLLAFAILINGTYDTGFSHSLQDRMCEEMSGLLRGGR